MNIALAFKAYRIPSYDGRPWQLMAEGSSGRFDIDQYARPNGRIMTVLDPKWGSAAAFYRMTIRPKSDSLKWLIFAAEFDVDGVPFVHRDAVVAGSVYIEEPTDMATEILRYREPHAIHEPHGHGAANAPFNIPSNTVGADWLVEIRRCA